MANPVDGISVAPSPRDPWVDRLAQFLARWDRLDQHQQIVCLDLMRGLSKLPDGADDGHLIAAANAQLAELRGERS